MVRSLGLFGFAAGSRVREGVYGLGSGGREAVRSPSGGIDDGCSSAGGDDDDNDDGVPVSVPVPSFFSGGDDGGGAGFGITFAE